MFVHVDGTDLNVIVEGEGPPVVLVHGLGGAANVWWGVMRALSAHHLCVAPDLRGHGRSGGRGKFSIEQWARDVRALIRHLELPPVTLVGHSLGTLIVQYLAQTEPEICDQLVLVGGISYFEPPVAELYRQRAETVEKEGMDALVDTWLAGALSPQTHATKPGVAALLRELFLRNDPQMYAKSCRALAKAPHIRRQDIGQPTLIIVGAHDRSTPLAMAEELKRDIPVSRVVVAPDGGHWLPVEDPSFVAAAILEFLT